MNNEQWGTQGCGAILILPTSPPRDEGKLFSPWLGCNCDDEPNKNKRQVERECWTLEQQNGWTDLKCTCLRACVRACVHAYVRTCVPVRVHMNVSVLTHAVGRSSV